MNQINAKNNNSMNQCNVYVEYSFSYADGDSF